MTEDPDKGAIGWLGGVSVGVALGLVLSFFSPVWTEVQGAQFMDSAQTAGPANSAQMLSGSRGPTPRPT